jgi:hypothetical protein
MFPVFDTINVFAGLVVPVNWLPNASEVADTVNVRTGATPVPVRPTGDPEIVTLPVMDAVPVDAPRAVGEYVTRIVQVEVAARVPPHVPPALANGAVTVTVIPVKLAPPVLFRVRVCAALVAPTATLPNANDVGVTLPTAAVTNLIAPISIAALLVFLRFP